jgi:hypothetical protein
MPWILRMLEDSRSAVQMAFEGVQVVDAAKSSDHPRTVFWSTASLHSLCIFRHTLQGTGLLHMPPWELRGGRAYSLICNRGISFPKVNGLQCLPAQAGSRKSVRTASCSASTAGYATQATETISLRKQLKDEAKAKRSAGSNGISKPSVESKKRVKGWELTVGIEIHAQLNTARKLFSRKYSVYIADSKLIAVRCGHFSQCRTKYSRCPLRYCNTWFVTNISESHVDSCITRGDCSGMLNTTYQSF